VQVIQTQNPLRLQLVPTQAEPPAADIRSAHPAQAVSAETLGQVRAWIGRLAAAAEQAPLPARLPGEPARFLEALRIFLEPFEPASGPEVIARRIREFCEDSGLFLELRLAGAVKRSADEAGRPSPPTAASPELPARILTADLKARLLLLKGFFEDAAGRELIAGRPEAARLARAAGEMLAELRAGQEQMARPAAAAEPFQMVHFALPMPDERQRVWLKLAYPRRRPAGTPDGHRAAILLQLDRMGAVRADLMLLGRSLNVSIFVSDPEVRDLVARHAPEVREALSAFFENVGVQVSVSTRKISQFVAEDCRPLGETQVDVRV
jgi:hypothetical protein